MSGGDHCPTFSPSDCSCQSCTLGSLHQSVEIMDAWSDLLLDNNSEPDRPYAGSGAAVGGMSPKPWKCLAKKSLILSSMVCPTMYLLRCPIPEVSRLLPSRRITAPDHPSFCSRVGRRSMQATRSSSHLMWVARGFFATSIAETSERRSDLLYPIFIADADKQLPQARPSSGHCASQDRYLLSRHDLSQSQILFSAPAASH